MTKEKAIKIADALFKSYPKWKKFFITHDGQAFFNASDADNHARTFKKEAEQEVVKVEREDVADGKEAKGTTGTKGGKDKDENPPADPEDKKPDPEAPKTELKKQKSK